MTLSLILTERKGVSTPLHDFSFFNHDHLHFCVESVLLYLLFKIDNRCNMKTLLVLTDFSESATRAAETAMMLAEPMNAEIILMNSYATIPVTTFYAGGAWVGEGESWWRDESITELKKLAAHLEQLPPANSSAGPLQAGCSH